VSQPSVACVYLEHVESQLEWFDLMSKFTYNCAKKDVRLFKEANCKAVCRI
jgi:hypothetical protein